MERHRLKTLMRRYLLPDMSGYSLRRELLAISDETCVLRGYCMESSRFGADEVTVHAVVQPLYTNVTMLRLSYSRNIGTFDVSIADETRVMKEIKHTIRRDGELFLSRSRTLNDFVERQDSLVHTRDHLFLEDRAGAYILLGNAEMARITLDEWLTAMKNGFRETNRSFFRDGEIRASMLKRMYLSQGLAKAQEHLNGCVSIMKAFFSTE